MTTEILKLEPTLCHGLVEAVAASLGAQAAKRGVRLVVAQNMEDIVARTDRKALGTILLSLVGHAIQSVPRGVVHISVIRSQLAGREAVEISLAEISAGGEKTPAVRAEAGALAHCHELAASLGGKLSIHCRAGEGSSYVLLIPAI
jgi:hypothetical protein